MLSLKKSLLRCKNHSEAQCIISSATVSLMSPETFLAATKNITLDTNILCNDDARQVERKIAPSVTAVCVLSLPWASFVSLICVLDYSSF